jgi:hypothetical protein
MKVAIYATTPIAGAPFLQYECLKKYAPEIEVKHIQQRNRYADGRVFPQELYISQAEGRNAIKAADVIHIHNYLPTEVEQLIDFKRQKVVATLHSCPRQGNWSHVIKRARKTFCIRQPMQMAEYKGFPTLPNMFDVWRWTPLENKNYKGNLNIVYCPSNKHANNKIASKGYETVMPLLRKLDERGDIGLIHHTGVEYIKNLQLKQHGHIVIDDIIGKGWHLTSIEGGCFGQVVLGNTPEDMGYPFIETNQWNITETVMRFIDNRDLLEHTGKKTRTWLEQNWDPKEQCKEYVKVYESL